MSGRHLYAVDFGTCNSYFCRSPLDDPQPESIQLLEGRELDDVTRLDDVDIGVRYRAQEALVRMTGAQVEPTVPAWRAWQAEHGEWQLPAAGAGAQ